MDVGKKVALPSEIELQTYCLIEWLTLLPNCIILPAYLQNVYNHNSICVRFFARTFPTRVHTNSWRANDR